MSLDQQKVLTRRYYEELWNGNLDVADEIVAANFNGGSREALKQDIAAFRAAFPDAQWAVEQQVAEGDTVVCRWSMRGTHQGGFSGIDIPATGKRVTWTGICIHSIVDGRTTGTVTETDWFGLLRQIGAVPPSAAGT